MWQNNKIGDSFVAFLLLVVAIFVVVIVNKLTTPSVEINLIDSDKDGYYTVVYEEKAADCNDNDSSINPGVDDIQGDGIDQDCDGADKLPEFNPNDFNGDYSQFNEFLSFKNQKHYVELYKNSVTPDPIDTKAIVNLSTRVKTIGTFENAYLFISAGAGDNDQLIARESVYFYVDTGDTGGHLIKSKSIPIDDSKIGNGHSNFLYKTSYIDLTAIPYKEDSTPVVRNIDLLEVLNNENHGYDRKHYIGAFVSSSRKSPTLFELGIAYKCASGSKCSITKIE